MKKMQRILACLLALVLAFGMSLTALAEEWTTTWDLTELYADDAAVEADFAEIEGMLAQIPTYLGTLNTAEGVVAWYAYESDLELRIDKLFSYGMMKWYKDMNDEAAGALYDRASNLYDVLDSETPALNAELFAQSEEFLDSLASDERMAPYSATFRRSRSAASHELSQEQAELLAPLEQLTNNAKSLFYTLNRELPRQELEFPDGVTRTVNEDSFGPLLSSKEQVTHDFLLDFSNALMSPYHAYRGTYAQTYSSYWTGKSALAKACGYSSALEAAMQQKDNDPTLYHAVIEASLGASDLLEHYAKLMKRGMGVDTIYGIDTNYAIMADPGVTFTYDEACEIMLAAFAPLGEDYVAEVRKALSSGWVDAYPAEGKLNDSYIITAQAVHPYMLLSFDGTIAGLRSMAYELGRTMNLWYSYQEQPPVYTAQPSVLTITANAQLHVQLLYDYLIENAATDTEKQYFIAAQLNMLYRDFFVQATSVYFQENSIAAIERGETLTADDLDQMWLDALDQFRGNGEISTTEYNATGWARISDFYSDYTLYRYIVAISAACDMARQITSGEEGAAENYLAYLASGDSASTNELLAVAGVDTSNADFVGSLLNRFGALMDEYEVLDAK